MAVTKVKRLEKTNERVTQNRTYVLHKNTYIYDDHGDTMNIRFWGSNGKQYWEKVSTDKGNNMKTLKIEEVTLINNRKADEVSSDELIELIKMQKQAIEDLKSLEESKFVSSKIAQATDNVATLMAILDSRTA